MTKIYTVFLLFCFSAVSVSAQFETGQKVLGGNLGFNIISRKYYPDMYNPLTQTSVYVNPSIGWFTKTNQLFGIGLTYNYYRDKSGTNNGTFNDTTTSNSHSIGINVFSQRFITLAHNFYFTVTTSGSGAYSLGRSNGYRLLNNADTRTSGYTVNVGLAPGLSYRLTQCFLFDAYLSNFLSAGFTHSRFTTTSTSGNVPHQDNFSLSSSLSNFNLGGVALGFRWLLKR